MRVYVALGLLSTALVTLGASALRAKDAPVLTKTFVDRINQLNGGMWKAVYNGKMQNITFSEAKRLTGAWIQKNSSLPPVRFTEEQLRTELPESFDSAEKWPNCPTIREIADQSACRASWAVSTASAISDRYCTVGGGKQLRISAAHLLSCCKQCGGGCKGGFPGFAWLYYVEYGIASSGCQPYPFPHCEHRGAQGNKTPCSKYKFDTPKCNATCTDKSIPLVKYRGNATYLLLHGEEDYKRELYFNGPFVAVFFVYTDLFAYKSGVYRNVDGDFLGGQAVRIVGWGKLNGTPYWKVANSWDTDWGMNGYMLILGGNNECNIEHLGFTGFPDPSQLT
uniref:Cathepsin B-like protease n=1 Tax=Trypanosoma congolense TaxID=5692 RepID=B2C332_TRYCO|nr:cathepsin B-like protease [Trypanosoma congolense]